MGDTWSERTLRWAGGLLLAVGCGGNGSPAGAGGTSTGGSGATGTGGAGSGDQGGASSSGGRAGAGGDGGAAGGQNAQAGNGGGGTTAPGTATGGRAGGGGTAIGGRTGGGGMATGGRTGGMATGGRGTGGLPACVIMEDTRAPVAQYKRSPNTTAPTPMGGPIAEGTYFLTDLTYHGGVQTVDPCFSSGVREILRFKPTSSTEGTLHDDLIFRYEDGSLGSSHPSEFAYRLEATKLIATTMICSGGSGSESYTATPDRIVYVRGPFDSGCDTGVTLALTFDKQP